MSHRRSQHEFRACVAALVLAGATARTELCLAQVSPLVAGRDDADWVLERDQWQVLQPISLEDLLQRLPGVVVARRGGLGSLEYVNIAGSLNGRIRLLVDGIEYTEPELQWPRLYAIPVSSIARLELYSSSDPARVEIWTRAPETNAPVTELDLARGDLVTRTRRVQLLTPLRPWRAGARYEELLRGDTDFRRVRPDPPPDQLGSYDGRNILVEAEITRADSSVLGFAHQDFNDNAHGSFASTADVQHATQALNSLRWRRPWSGGGMQLMLDHFAWDRDRRVDGEPQAANEGRGRAAVDLEWAGPGSPALRLRARDERGDLVRGTGTTRYLRQQYDAEVAVHGGAGRSWRAFAGAHHHTEWGTSWSARVQLRQRRGGWLLQARAGRGVSFAGAGENVGADVDAGLRAGAFVACGAGHTTTRTHWNAVAYHKELRHGSAGLGSFFPALGSGPRRLAGVMADAGLRWPGQRFFYELELKGAWTPYVDGDRAGLAPARADLLVRVSRSAWFDGDLSLALQALGRLESTRRFTSQVALADLALLDLGLEARVLRRMLVFWTITNVLDTLYETHPGVLMPGRSSLVGVQVRLLD